ncbi:MAG: ThiF family adenylyltransferase [Candidatus Woesearchaeota archaeon]
MITRKSRIYKNNLQDLEKKKVTIIGCGGTGSWLAELLAKAGINLLLVDYDIVEESNLERQNYFLEEIGKLKVDCLKNRLKKFSNIETLPVKVDSTNLNDIPFNDLCVDCTDDINTKIAIARFCLDNRRDYLFTSVQKNHGFVYLYTPQKSSILKIYKNKIPQKLNEVGVMNSAVMFLSSLAASFVIKYLLNEPIPSEILYFNLELLELTRIRIKDENKK